MTATLIQSPDRVVLKNISWQTYQSLVIDFEREPAMRLTYDLGTLEIRMPLALTCSREDLAKGLEPDQCYYIQNEAMVRGVEQIDLTKLPPPDLAVEIDITSSSLDRFSIYAALKVPEIWRYDGQLLTIYGLAVSEYIIQDSSIALPGLKTEDILQFLSLSASLTSGLPSAIGENNLVQQFRQWLINKYSL
jgi:hypothetical protein